MPFDRSIYPADWEAISEQIRFGRAGGVCEQPGCGVKHGETVYRYRPDGELYLRARGLRFDDGQLVLIDGAVVDLDTLRTSFRAVRIILTTAHLCECWPPCGDPNHLLCLCQLHHFRLDAERHRLARRRNRRHGRARAGQGFLFEGIEQCPSKRDAS